MVTDTAPSSGKGVRYGAFGRCGVIAMVEEILLGVGGFDVERGAEMTVVIAIHTPSHQIPFQECWSVIVIHKLPDSTLDHICCQLATAYQLVLKSQHSPGLNIR